MLLHVVARCCTLLHVVAAQVNPSPSLIYALATALSAQGWEKQNYALVWGRQLAFAMIMLEQTDTFAYIHIVVALLWRMSV